MRTPLTLAALVLIGAFLVDRFVQPLGTGPWIVVGAGVAFTALASIGVEIYARIKLGGRHDRAR